MKLNPLKWAFGVASDKFLGFMVHQRGIKANPEKIRTLLEMHSPRKPNEVQSLTGQIAALSRFVSRSPDKCLSFFNALKGAKKFEWTEKCGLAFQKLKEHLEKPHLLSKPITGERLFLYLAVSESATSSVLVREDSKVQHSVYYVSKRLLDAELRYLDMEKLVYALVINSRKLLSYF